MKEDKATRIWKIISPPIVYLFVQMIMELVIAVSAVFLELTGIYKKYGLIKDSSAVVEKIWYLVEQNATYTVALSAIAVIVIFGRTMLLSGRKDNKIESSDIFPVVFFAVMLSLAVSNLISAIQIDNIYGSYESASGNLLQGNIIYRLVAIGILTPVAEEIIYRGLVYDRAKKEFGTIGAMIVSSAAFGIFHFNLVQGIYAFLIGIAFAWFYEKFGSLSVSIFMHMAINIVAVLLDYYGVTAITENSLVIRIVLMLAEFAAAAYTFEIINKKSDKKRGI
ncbi:MAG: CPBP family intramembrane metalloprotease [Lachnospiraceae bacterium]|nr:CPBP family intramembrane metalloprotease [Lachnospiraceae bacterium]